MLLKDKFIDPFTDFGFKQLFGTEPNKELLIDFLNQILPEKHRIQELAYLSVEKLGATIADRKAIFDLYCTSPTGERFIVEIQKSKQNFFQDRSLFYATFPVQDQALKRGWDFKLDPVYMVGILDFVFANNKNNTAVKHEIQLKDQNCQVFYDKLTFIYLEMPKFDKSEDQLISNFDKWLYVLKHLPNLENRPKALQERIFQKLFDAAEIARFQPEEKAAYEVSLKYYRDMNNIVNTAYGDGIFKGIEIGKAEGKEEGRAEATINLILKAHQEGLSLETIALLTNKPIAEIQKILTDNNL